MSFRKDRDARKARRTSLVRPNLMLRRGPQEKKGAPGHILPARHEKDIETDERRKHPSRGLTAHRHK